jgi:hypothetical protein
MIHIAKLIWHHIPKVYWEKIRGCHDLLGQKPPSLFILQGWSSISMASLTMPSMYLISVARIELNAVSLVDNVFSYSRLVWMF